jgi:hypothetical protein
LETSDELTKKELPDLLKSEEKILKIGKKIKLAKSLGIFKCPSGDKGCRSCRPYEMILKGEAELVGQDEYRSDVYVIDKPTRNEEEDSKVL